MFFVSVALLDKQEGVGDVLALVPVLPELNTGDVDIDALSAQPGEMHLHRVQYAEADPTCALTVAASICARAPWRPSRRVHDVATTHAADGAPCWSLHPPKRHTPQVRIAIVLRVNACEFFLLSVRVDDLIMIWSRLARSRLV